MPEETSGLPDRRLTGQELEAVIRRAVELQSARTGAEEGVTEAEVVRIGQELGLEPASVRRAIADVRAGATGEHGALTQLMGPSWVRAIRTLRRPAAEVGMLIEQHLVEREYMVPHRRLPDRTRYVRDPSVAATLGRAADSIGSRGFRLDLKQLDIAVSALDPGSSLVELAVDLGATRAGLATGGIVGGGAGATGVGIAVWAASVAPPLALVGIPLLIGLVWGARGIYGHVAHSTQEKLEAFLDRVEHGELVPAGGAPGWRRRLGI